MAWVFRNHQYQCRNNAMFWQQFKKIAAFFDDNSRRLQSVCSCGISREQVSDVHPGHVSDYTHPWIAGGSHHSHQPEQDSPHCLLHRQVRALLLHIEDGGVGVCALSVTDTAYQQRVCEVYVWLLTNACAHIYSPTHAHTHTMLVCILGSVHLQIRI